MAVFISGAGAGRCSLVAVSHRLIKEKSTAMTRRPPIPGCDAPADPEDWYQTGLRHIWLPYAQMKTVRPPLPVARTHGCRIVLADGRELIDGIASWWTACHGYNHPHIRAAVERQLARMPHVMFGGLVHEPALTLARRLAALMPGGPGSGILLRLRIGRG